MDKKNIKTLTIILSIAITISVAIPSIYLLTLSTTGHLLFTDSKNRISVIPNNPQRIISMAPSITEILYELEVEDRLVGATDYCNYPAEASQKTSVGGFSTPNLEVIASLNPDLIIAATYEAEKVQQLSSMGVPVIIILAYSLDDIINNIGIIGGLVNATAKATEVTSDLKNRMNAITSKTSTLNESDKIKCYFEVWETPIVAGGGTFINDMIQKAGGVNIFADQTLEWPAVSNEVVISRNPEAIFITEHSAPWYSMSVCERTGYNAIDACKNNRIYVCNDDVYLRPGPRIIDALGEMTQYLHPNL